MYMTTVELIREAERAEQSTEMAERLHAGIRDMLSQGAPRADVRAELERAYDAYDAAGQAEKRDAVGLVLDCLDGYCSSYAAL
jgi:hypothetical protein